MYRVRPYFEIKKVRLPHCMYLVKPLHKLSQIKTGPDEVGRGGEGSGGGARIRGGFDKMKRKEWNVNLSTSDQFLRYRYKST